MSSAYYAGSSLSTAEQLALDARLSSLETMLLLKAPSNPFGGNEAIIGTGGVPAVSGIALVPQLGVLTVSWSPSPVSNLLYYEIAISTTNDFTNPTTVRWTQTQYTYAQGVSGTTYYVRVRAVDQNNGVGPWSAVLNSATGLATSNDLGFQAATNIVTYKTTNFFPSSLSAIGGAEDTEIWGAAPIYTKGGIVTIAAALVCAIWGTIDGPGGQVRLYSQLVVDGVPIGDSLHFDLGSPGWGLNVDMVIPIPVDPFDSSVFTPLIGVHYVGVELTLENNNWSALPFTVTPSMLKMTLLELRR